MAEPSYDILQEVYNVAVASATTITGLGLSQANVDKADAIILSATSAQVNFTMGGTTPTGTIGHPLLNTAPPLILYGRKLIASLKFFSASGTVNAALLVRT